MIISIALCFCLLVSSLTPALADQNDEDLRATYRIPLVEDFPSSREYYAAMAIYYRALGRLRNGDEKSVAQAERYERAAASGRLDEPPAEKAKVGRCKRGLFFLGKFTLKGIGALGVAALGVALVQQNRHHDLWALITGQEHVGYGIYLDMDRILAGLTREERELLRDPKRNAEAIARMFGEKLRGDYDYSRIRAGGFAGKGTGENFAWYSHDYAGGIGASHFLLNRGQPRGLCRHKAAVLVALLNRVGVPAEFEGGMMKKHHHPTGAGSTEETHHAYVYLPVQKLIVEPTIEGPESPVVSDAREYREKNIEYRVDPQTLRRLDP